MNYDRRISLMEKGIIDPEREQDVWEEVALEAQTESQVAIEYVVGLVRRYAIRAIKNKDLQPPRDYADRLITKLEDYQPSQEMMDATGDGRPVYTSAAICLQIAGRICEMKIMTGSF